MEFVLLLFIVAGAICIKYLTKPAKTPINNNIVYIILQQETVLQMRKESDTTELFCRKKQTMLICAPKEGNVVYNKEGIVNVIR